MTHRDSSILPRDPGDVREINLVHPQPQPHSSTSSLSRQRERKNGDTPHFDPTDGYTQATHVILPPSGTGAVYQTTNPMVRIAEQGVLGVAQLERYVPSYAFTMTHRGKERLTIGVGHSHFGTRPRRSPAFIPPTLPTRG